MERIAHNELPDGLYQAMKHVQNFIDNSGLDLRLLELMRMRVSQMNGCAYCLDMHYKDSVHAGEDPLRLISLPAWRETPYYSEREQAVLTFAERLTKINTYEHCDDIHDELSKFFTKHEIAYLTIAVTQINSWNRITRSFGSVPGKYKVGDHK